MRYLGRNSMSSLLTTLFNILWYVVIVSGGALALATIVSGILHLTGVIDLIALAGRGHQKLSLYSSGMEIVLEGQRIQAGLGLVTTVIVALLVFIPISLLMLHHLRRLMASFAKESPFSTENVGRIRWIGCLFIAGTVFEALVRLPLGLYMANKVSVPDVEINVRLGLNWSVAIAGLIILVLAEIFRLGAELKEDQDLTV